MKLLSKIVEIILAILLPLLTFTSVNAQTNHAETVHKTVNFTNNSEPDNEIYIRNINGNVSVEGYDGTEIQITYDKMIEAKNQTELKKGIDELELIIDEDHDLIMIYLDAPFINFKKTNSGISYNMKSRDKNDYDFKYNITVKVPNRTNLDVSTITDGDVFITGMRGQHLEAGNINGSVQLKNVEGITDVHTINGDITVSYLHSPLDDSSYKTINGTINVHYPKNLSADITFKSLNGDLYTDFDDVQRINPVVEKSNSRRGNVTRYRIDKQAPIRFGNGGPKFQFDVLNGDVYIRKS